MITKAINEIDEKLYSSDTVIGEFSGRDSVAAIMKALESEDVNYILPIATFAGTEYGDFDVLYENYLLLKEQVRLRYGDDKLVYDLVEYSDQKLWHLLNGRFATELINKFGFYNPCIGCHLYFHLTKIKFANQFSKKIISGERASHDGRVKVNQLPEVLSTYRKVMAGLGYDLMMPIENLSDGEAVEKLIGWDWDEGKAHPKCVLSGNYRNTEGKALYKKDQLDDFLCNYIEKVGLLAGDYVLGHMSIKSLEASIKDII